MTKAEYLASVEALYDRIKKLQELSSFMIMKKDLKKFGWSTVGKL